MGLGGKREKEIMQQKYGECESREQVKFPAFSEKFGNLEIDPIRNEKRIFIGKTLISLSQYFPPFLLSNEYGDNNR